MCASKLMMGGNTKKKRLEQSHSPPNLRKRKESEQKDAPVADSEPFECKKSNGTVEFGHNENVGWYTRWQRRKALQRYNEHLEELKQMYEKDEELMMGDAPTSVEDEKAPDRLLANLRFLLTIGLVCTNFLSSLLSGSLAIVSTFVDSLMDITSSAIIGGCLFLINNTNSFHYPRGRGRLELVGVILCSVIMGVANVAVVFQSVTQIINGDMKPEVNLPVLAMMLGGSAVKSALMVACYKRASSSSLVLAMDMRNDIMTSLVAVTCAFIGYRYWPYADPVGAICVCGWIAMNWFQHAAEHLPILVGVRAERENLSRILKITLEHDDRIKYIDHVMVYHTGLEAIVELHIVMDENLPLKVTHDISHPLEKKLMRLDFVERAFVHCDYDCDGD